MTGSDIKANHLSLRQRSDWQSRPVPVWIVVGEFKKARLAGRGSVEIVLVRAVAVE